VSEDGRRYREALLAGRELRPGPEERVAYEVAESNLVDEYAAGLLPGDDRDRFERNFLVTEERRESVAVARGILRLANRERQRRRVAGLAAAVIVAAAVYWVPLRTPSDVATVAVTVGNSRRGGLPPEVKILPENTTLILEISVDGGAPECVATITRVGEREPHLRVRTAGGSLIRIPVMRDGLSEGDYLVTLEGPGFRRDGLFRVVTK
jgi:hypothetical protein